MFRLVPECLSWLHATSCLCRSAATAMDTLQTILLSIVVEILPVGLGQLLVVGFSNGAHRLRDGPSLLEQCRSS